MTTYVKFKTFLNNMLRVLYIVSNISNTWLIMVKSTITFLLYICMYLNWLCNFIDLYKVIPIVIFLVIYPHILKCTVFEQSCFKFSFFKAIHFLWSAFYGRAIKTNENEVCTFYESKNEHTWVNKTRNSKKKVDGIQVYIRKRLDIL